MNNAANALSAWPLILYVIAAAALVGIMVGLSYLLGQHHDEPQTDTAFESGIKVTGSARLRFSVQFYLVAMFFVIFDLESVFIVAWAIAFYDAGWMGYIAVLVFIFILVVVLIYEWRVGALNFGPNNKRILKAYRKHYRKSINI